MRENTSVRARLTISENIIGKRTEMLMSREAKFMIKMPQQS